MSDISVPVGVVNVLDYGAWGNGMKDDTAALQLALGLAVSASGCLYIPAGTYKLTRPLTLNNCAKRIAIRGDGENVSVLEVHGGGGALDFTFAQNGARQPWGLNLQNVGFHAVGVAGTAIRISYGNPDTTIDHRQPSTVIRNVSVVSDDVGQWTNGIDITAAWNCKLTDVYVSGGDPVAMNWNTLSGHGIQMNRMCINSHLSNVQCNNWAVGFYYNAAGGRNTEGLFFTNCSFVAVKRGVWICGNPAIEDAPRVSTFTWTGGMIECRVKGVTTGSAAFHLQHIWTALIMGCQMLAETVTENGTDTYGVVAQNSSGIVVTACDINAFIFGVATTDVCRAINIHGNTFTNVANQVVFNPGTVQSRSYGHVRFNNEPCERDFGVGNCVGFAEVGASRYT